MEQRRFPPPWSVEELDACFVVKDSTGQKLGYFYYEEEPGRRLARFPMRSASWKILSLKIYTVVHGTSHERTKVLARVIGNDCEIIDSNGVVLMSHSS